MMDGLSGKRILIVEDDYFEASELAARLTASGVEVVGPVPDVDRALGHIWSDHIMDGAILDINLGGDMVFPVADELERRGLPFVFATGYDSDIVPPRHADKILLRKPLDDDAAVAALAHATIVDTVTAKEAAQNAILQKLSRPDLDALAPRFRKVHLPQGAIMEVQN